MKRIPTKIYLEERDLPKSWYNMKADMAKQHDPMLHPGTLKPCVEEDLAPLFCTELISQEFNTTDRFIEIPQGIADFYHMFRPSPLIRAYSLEKQLQTPARIFYKFEGTNTSGSHKLNTAVAQAFYAKEQGITNLSTETGAGQWGTALSMACAFYGMDLTVFMVKGSYNQKPYRKIVMETYGARVVPSPSDTTKVGSDILLSAPETSGSLGCAISEAVEYATTHDNCRYVLGSVLDHVILHQTIIGLEAKTALEKIDVYPDIVIGCAGGGSNLGGLIAPFMGDKLTGKANPYFIAVEPASCPTLTRGRYAYDFGDTGKITPLMRMYTLGSGFMPASIHAGGLRYHGMSPILSKLYHDGHLDEARSYEQTKVFGAASTFLRCEGILPAPESSHAILAAIDEAIKCREGGYSKDILFNLSGTGYFDMGAYANYNEGIMVDYVPSDEELEKYAKTLPIIPGIQE